MRTSTKLMGLTTSGMILAGVIGLGAMGVMGGAGGAGGAGAGEPTAAAPAGSAASKSYAVDALHASVVFKIKHLNASNFYGSFNEIGGTFALGETASFDVSVKAESVDSRNDKRDQHIKSPDFLSAKEFPEMTAKATGLKKTGENTFKGTADLTFRGVTKPIEITLIQTGAGKGMDGKTELAGIESSFTFKRSDFGSKGLIGPVSDEVSITVALEGAAK